MMSESQTQTFFEKIKALFTGEQADGVAKLSAELAKVTAAENATIESLRQTLATKESEITNLQGQLATSSATVTSLTAERDALKATVVDPAGTIKTEAAKIAAAALASNGIPADKLDAVNSPAGESYEAVQKKLMAETDPVKKAELAAKCRELRGHGDLFAAAK